MSEQLYTLHQALERFAKEDIEVYVNVTLAAVHPNEGPDFSGLAMDRTMITVHFLDENGEALDIGDIGQLKENTTLTDLAELLGIDPNLAIWQIEENVG